MSTAPFARRRLTVTGVQELGAYRVLRAAPSPSEAPSSPGGDASPRGERYSYGEPSSRWELVPGQFAMLAAVERWGGGEGERPYLARAFSVARVVHGECHFLLEDVGPGTRRLSEVAPGEELWALGPLGRGFRPPGDGRRALLVGGGVGIAPLAILQDALSGAGEGVPAAWAVPAGSSGAAPASGATVLLGFRDRHRAAGAALLQDAQLATDDGSVGHRGRVTELLAAELERDRHAVVYACGPAPMLEGVRAMCEREHVPAQLALEAGMACGFGACFGCVVPRRGGGYLRVCVDGPVIDAAELEHVDEHAGASA